MYQHFLLPGGGGGTTKEQVIPPTAQISPPFPLSPQ